LRNIEEEFSYGQYLVARLYPVADPMDKSSAATFNSFVKMLNQQTPKLIGVVTQNCGSDNIMYFIVSAAEESGYG